MFQTYKQRLSLRAPMLFVALAIAGSDCDPPQVEGPTNLVGGASPVAGGLCLAEFEAVPAAVGPRPQTGVEAFAAMGFNRMSVAQGGWDQWSAGSPNTSGFRVPVNPNDPLGLQTLGGDAWATYSPALNLAFFYFIGRRGPGTGSCVAVAATPPALLPQNQWTSPAACISQSRGDQCAIIREDTTNTFLAACGHSGTDGDNPACGSPGQGGPKIRLQAFTPCMGAPGPANGCARTACVDVPSVNLLQFSIAVNPCTNNFVLVYRNLRNEVRLGFFDNNLNQVSDFLVRANENYAQGQTNAGCGNGTIRRCGLGTTDCCNTRMANCRNNPIMQCLRVNGRPSVDTHRETTGGGSICRAVIAYDSLVPASDGNLWAKSRLEIVDITDENDPAVERSWISTSDQFAWNHYLSSATVNRFATGRSTGLRVGWSWLTDIRGACAVIAEGAVSRDMAQTVRAIGPLSGPFPAAYMSSFGINDYNRGIKGGDPNGWLYMAWGEPVPTTVTNCVRCMGRSWNLAARMSRVNP